MLLPKKENLGGNWERVAVFGCDVWNLQVQNSTSGKTRTETLIHSLV